MTGFDNTDPHVPTPEFRASLEREIARAYRAERQFSSSRGTRLWLDLAPGTGLLAK